MQVQSLALPEVKLITHARMGDDRGWFSEVWNRRAFAEAGMNTDFVQENHAYSAQPFTVRGLHYQSPPHAQDKLVRVVRGRVWDVVVDYRTGSPSFGRWVAAELSAEGGEQILAPKGFLHGLVTLEPDTHVIYLVSAHFAPTHDAAVRWNDPDLDIDWPLGGREPILSAKDRAAPFLADAPSPFHEGP